MLKYFIVRDEKIITTPKFWHFGKFWLYNESVHYSEKRESLEINF